MDMFREIVVQGGNFSAQYGIRPNTLIVGRDKYDLMKKQLGGLLAMETEDPDRFMGMKIILCEKDPEYFNIAFRDPSLE